MKRSKLTIYAAVSSIVMAFAIWTTVHGQIYPRADGFTMGNGTAAAPIQIDMFIDLLCPDCKASHPVIEKVAEHYGPQTVRVRFHLFPLPYHQYAFTAATAAHTIVSALGTSAFEPWMKTVYHYQEKFWNRAVAYKGQAEVTDEFGKLAHHLFPSLKDSDWRKGMSGYGGTVMDGKARRSWHYGGIKGVSGTPTFFVNDVNVPADPSWTLDKWKDLIDPLLKQLDAVELRVSKSKDEPSADSRESDHVHVVEKKDGLERVEHKTYSQTSDKGPIASQSGDIKIRAFRGNNGTVSQEQHSVNKIETRDGQVLTSDDDQSSKLNPDNSASVEDRFSYSNVTSKDEAQHYKRYIKQTADGKGSTVMKEKESVQVNSKHERIVANNEVYQDIDGISGSYGSYQKSTSDRWTDDKHVEKSARHADTLSDGVHQTYNHEKKITEKEDGSQVEKDIVIKSTDSFKDGSTLSNTTIVDKIDNKGRETVEKSHIVFHNGKVVEEEDRVNAAKRERFDLKQKKFWHSLSGQEEVWESQQDGDVETVPLDWMSSVLTVFG